MKRFLLLLGSVCLLFHQTTISYANTISDYTNSYNTQASSNIEKEKTITYFNIENAPNVNSEAAIVMEASTGAILYGKNIHGTYYPASITKVLTALVALENSSLRDTVTHSKKAIFDVDLKSSRIGIDVGEELTMEQSLYGILLESANEVSYAVAEHVAGDVDSFSRLMNEKAKSLGALNSNFTNPHGLPDEDHYTSVYDMALISRAAIENEAFKKITKTRTYAIPPTNVQEETRYLANHHRFIRNPNQFDGCVGGKTGYTSKAKYTLVTFAERDGMTLISVIMKCDSIANEYSDTKALLDFGFDNFSLYNIMEMEGTDSVNSLESPLFTKYSPLFDPNNSNLQVNNTDNVILPKTASFADAKREIEFTPLETITEGNNIIGKINYIYNDIYIGSAGITYNYDSQVPLLTGSYVPPVPVALLEEEEVTNMPQSETQEKNKTTIIIYVVIGIAVFLLALYITFIEIPHRRKRSTYRQRRARRKRTSIDF